MRTESYTCLWVQKYLFRWQFDTVTIQQNNSNSFIHGVYVFPSLEFLVQIYSISISSCGAGLNPIRKSLFICITFMPLLHPETYLARLVNRQCLMEGKVLLPMNQKPHSWVSILEPHKSLHVNALAIFIITIKQHAELEYFLDDQRINKLQALHTSELVKRNKLMIPGTVCVTLKNAMFMEFPSPLFLKRQNY